MWSFTCLTGDFNTVLAPAWDKSDSNWQMSNCVCKKWGVVWFKAPRSLESLQSQDTWNTHFIQQDMVDTLLQGHSFLNSLAATENNPKL